MEEGAAGLKMNVSVMRMMLWMLVVMLSCRQVQGGDDVKTGLHEQNSTRSPHQELLKKLSLTANKEDPPQKGNTDIVFYFMSLKLLQVNEKDHSIVIGALISSSWSDHRVQWEAEDFNGITHLKARPGDVWMPDIYSENGAPTHTYEDILLILGGGVRRFTAQNIHLHCHLDIQDFPFDKQTCQIKFTTGFFPVTFDYHEAHHAIDDESLLTLPQWKITSFSGKAVNGSADGRGSHGSLVFTLVMQRVRSYYIYTMVWPAVLCALFAPVLFLVSSKKFERLVLGGCLLVCEFITLAGLQATIPPTGSVPLIVEYHVYVMTFTFVIVLLTLITSNMAARVGQCRRPTCMSSSVFLNWLAKVLCVPRGNYANFENKENNAHNLDTRRTSEISVQASSATDTDVLAYKSRSDEILEWHMIADLLDRLFFVIATVLIVLGTFAMVPH